MRVNEIFYSIQGEGRHTGSPAVFVRFSGCNLKCPFCDTEFSAYKEMTEMEIAGEVKRIAGECCFVVLTGGEPTMQVTDTLLDLLHYNGFYVAMETNGAFIDAQEIEVDFITLSPKDYYLDRNILKTFKADEVKLVMDDNIPLSVFDKILEHVDARYYYVQPCDTGDTERNKRIIDRAIGYIKDKPRWRLSLQTQKIINVR